MAIYNEILVGRYARFLQKLFGIKGGVPAKQLAGEVMPVFPLFAGRENRYLEGWNTFFIGINLAASAANQNAVQFRNPPNSNVIAVFEKITFSNPGAAAAPSLISNGPVVTDLAGGVFSITGGRLDPRGNPTSTLIASFAQVAAPGDLANAAAFGTLAINSLYDLVGTDIQEWPLLPGDGIRFRTNLVNNASAWIVMWRERFLEDSERA